MTLNRFPIKSPKSQLKDNTEELGETGLGDALNFFNSCNSVAVTNHLRNPQDYYHLPQVLRSWGKRQVW